MVDKHTEHPSHQHLNQYGWEHIESGKEPGDDDSYHVYQHDHHGTLQVNHKTGSWHRSTWKGKDYDGGSHVSLQKHLQKTHGYSLPSGLLHNDGHKQFSEQEPRPVSTMVYSESYFQPSVSRGETNEQFAENTPPRNQQLHFHGYFTQQHSPHDEATLVKAIKSHDGELYKGGFSVPTRNMKNFKKATAKYGYAQQPEKGVGFKHHISSYWE